jgi:HAD superfamily hydrolase (TIGR01509 family)
VVTLPALIFDCDGVLADTERFGHLPAFNQTFAHFGVPAHWSDDEYASKVLIGGGKERMASLLTPSFVERAGLPTDAGQQREMVADWHRHKTRVYTDLVDTGAMPARPGIARIVGEAIEAGWMLAVASTSAEPAVRAVLERSVGPAHAAKFAVFAGDIVPAKKPAPDIYELALRELQVPASEAIVVEDSANGLRAAAAAGIRTIITVSAYTRNEDFTGAALVVTSLGDADGEATEILHAASGIHPGRVVRLADLSAILRSPNLAATTERKSR